MKNNEINQAKEIREQYVDKKESNLDRLKKLDAKVKRPAEAFAYAFGTIGALVLGVGMCLALKVIGNIMPLGIVIGVLGIAMVSVNYLIYSRILKKSKAKHTDQVLALSDEILNQENND